LIRNCRSCGRSTLVRVTDLGKLRIPDFRSDTKIPPRYRLELVRCVACNLVQLSETVPRDVLYTDGYGFYSGINDRTKSELEGIVQDALHRQAPQGERLRWLDIGCNDGTLLSFVPVKHYRVGVDPVAKFAALADRYADEVHVELFDPTTFDEPFDVITSVAMFYDLDEPDEFVEDVRGALDDGGLWVVQQNDLESMIRTNAVDNISHEHLTYWSLWSFRELIRRHDMEVEDVTYSDLNGGCMRCFVRKREVTHAYNTSVRSWLEREQRAGLDKSETYRRFNRRANDVLSELRDVIRIITLAEDQVFIYGASNRGSTLWQAAGIESMIPYAVERNPDKVGLNFSSIGVPIISEDEMRERQPEYLLVGPWWFRDMFARREKDYLQAGGALIFPLPEVEVITA
jgi:SAM-dependent methyltransferase